MRRGSITDQTLPVIQIVYTCNIGGTFAKSMVYSRYMQMKTYIRVVCVTTHITADNTNGLQRHWYDMVSYHQYITSCTIYTWRIYCKIETYNDKHCKFKTIMLV